MVKVLMLQIDSYAVSLETETSLETHIGINQFRENERDTVVPLFTTVHSFLGRKVIL